MKGRQDLGVEGKEKLNIVALYREDMPGKKTEKKERKKRTAAAITVMHRLFLAGVEATPICDP